MDETHFEDTGARIFKYCFFAGLLALTGIGLWKKEVILGYFSFREHGEARIAVYATPGTTVSVMEEEGRKRELGLVGRDGKFTLVEQNAIRKVRVRLEHPYYFPEERLFERVEKGESATFLADMAPLLGSLHVTSFPSGASVYINEKKTGVTPWTQRDIRHASKRFVDVRLEGYIPQQREVVITGGKEEEVVFSLISAECTILLETDKPGFAYDSLKVFVDGQMMTLENQTVRFIQPGRRKVEIVSHDGLKIDKTFNIKPGQNLHLKLPDWFVEDGS